MLAASSAAFFAPASPMASDPDGNAARHLRDREKRIQAVQRL